MGDKTGAIGLSRLDADLARQRATPEEIAIQRGIDATMRDVIRKDARWNPVTRDGDSRRSDPPSAAVRETGWRDQIPLAPSPGQDIIKRLCDELAPHGPKSRAG
jgi:hypothetical protein